MTNDQLGPAELDRLADYIGGALDPSDDAEVARLIAGDARWRETYELLAPAMTAVGAELGALGSAPEPMPADLAVRLDDALAGAAGPAASPITEPTTIDPALATPTEPHLEPVRGGEPVRGERHLSVVPGAASTEPARTVPGSRRRKRLRWAAPIAAAAAALTVAGFSIDYLASSSSGDDAATSAAGSAADEAAVPMMGGTAPGGEILESGVDYTRATLANAPAVAAGGTDRAEQSNKEPGGGVAPRTAPPVADLRSTELARLRARDALQACIDALARVHGAGPITPDSVDFARFTGRPALIIRFSVNGLTWAYAVGANCGAPGAGADSLARVQVG
jgi:hypothetical protein